MVSLRKAGGLNNSPYLHQCIGVGVPAHALPALPSNLIVLQQQATSLVYSSSLLPSRTYGFTILLGRVILFL